MGGIYTLGVSPGTIIYNNLIHDVDANLYGGWGIYADEGSAHLLIENNVVYNTEFSGFNIHYGKEITVRNNIFALGKYQQLSRTYREPHQSVYFENNIIYWKEGVLLDVDWGDQGYDFYFQPAAPSGTRRVYSTFEYDWNVYYNPTLTVDEVSFDGHSFNEWKLRGKDAHSLYADPLFVDPENGNFTLRPESPALSLGFNQIDISIVGPRGYTGIPSFP
jgi:parallel beta-helix repeat protein